MKGIVSIFADQVRSGEIWKRVWELNKFKQFDSYGDWKKYSTRALSRDDVPAIILTLLLCVGLIALLISLAHGANVTWIISGTIIFLYLLKRGVSAFQKQSRNKNGGS